MGRARAGWPIRSVAAGQLASLVRLAIFLAIASSTVASLVLMLPVAAYYQTADFTEASFDLEIDGVISPDVENRLQAFAEPGSTSTLIAIDPALLRANGREVGSAKVYISPQPDTVDNSWFRDSQAVEVGVRDTRDWIDVSADAARALGVAPGDTISVPFRAFDVPFTVRRIMAIARLGIRDIAIAPLSPAMRNALASADSGAMPSVMFMRTGASADAVVAALSALPGGSKLQVQTRAQWSAQTALDPVLSEPVRLGATGLGIATLIALALREGHALFDRRRRAFSVLVALGATTSRVVATALLVESVPVCTGVLVAWVTTRDLAYHLVFAAALPPVFNGPLALGLTAAGCAYLFAVGVSTSRRLRRHDLVLALTTP